MTNIEFVSICDHPYQGTKEYGISIQTRDLGINMERLWGWDLNQGHRDEDGNIQEGWENAKSIGRYYKDGKIQEVL